MCVWGGGGGGDGGGGGGGGEICSFKIQMYIPLVIVW